MDSTTLALSGEDDVPSPPEGAFFMIKDGWLHEGRHTDSRRKRMMDRTNKDNLSLSNCVCWGTYYQYSSGDDIFKCCFKGQCLNWIYACSAQWIGSDGL